MVKAPKTGWTMEDLLKFQGKCPICSKIIEVEEPQLGLHFKLSSKIVHPLTGQVFEEYYYLGVCEKHEGSPELEKLSIDIQPLAEKHGIEVSPEVSASEPHERKLENMVRAITRE
jgi:hypothetical protein